jgi:TetR/AcrR family transcriptional regulator, fatty acid metabolism regulator protein
MIQKSFTKRKLQAIKSKEYIYQIAMELINKKGFDNVTIKDICIKAGVSIGAYYHYFSSKEAIFYEIYKIADDYFKNKVSKQLVQESSVDQIIFFFRIYANYNNNQGLDAISQLYNSKNKLFIAKGRYMHLLLEKIIKEGQEKNEIKNEMLPKDMADYLFIVARGIVYDWVLHDNSYNLENKMVEYLNRLIVIFIKTLKNI